MRIAPRHLLASIAAAAMATSAHSVRVFSLAGDGPSLIRFDAASPGAVTVIGALSGAVTALDGLDFRPADGNLYGHQAGTFGIYRVDLGSGATTLVGTASALGFAAGDVRAGANPNVPNAAYTHSDRFPASGTTLFYIDPELDTLVSAASPNAGALNTVGALSVVTDMSMGFDIVTDTAGLDTAYASLRVLGVDGLYSIDLVTGVASLIGVIGASRPGGLAGQWLPESGSLGLLAAAGLATFGVRRRASQRLGPSV